MIKIVSVNISSEKGKAKQPVGQARLTSRGIDGDAHAGSWHRQVSILSQEAIAEFSKQANRVIMPGEFAENLTISGIDLSTVDLFDRFYINDVVLEVTQIGKSCHNDKCDIFKEVGLCMMPTAGVFTRVIEPGFIKVDDALLHVPAPLKAAVITVSDRAFIQEYEDKSGPAIEDALRRFACDNMMTINVERAIVPDNEERVSDAICGHLGKCDILITTGGTGIGPRDLTVDVVRPMLDKELHGVMEMVRAKYGPDNPNVYLSRSIAGVVRSSLVFCLPGSPAAASEYMGEINKVLLHAVCMLRGINVHA